MNLLLQRFMAIAIACFAALAGAGKAATAATPETLHLDVFIGEADSWNVTSTLIYGKTEAILVDSQFRISQARNLADRVAGSRRYRG